jgi:hypothetical protein
MRINTPGVSPSVSGGRFAGGHALHLRGMNSMSDIGQLKTTIEPRAFERNAYAYADNNPVRYIDPTGQISECAKRGLADWGTCFALSFFFVDVTIIAPAVGFGCLALGPISASACLGGVLEVLIIVEIAMTIYCTAFAYDRYRKCCYQQSEGSS